MSDGVSFKYVSFRGSWDSIGDMDVLKGDGVDEWLGGVVSESVCVAGVGWVGGWVAGLSVVFLFFVLNLFRLINLSCLSC